MPIVVDVDVMMARRKMSAGELAEAVGITPANLAVLKNGRAKAVRFTTLAALCRVLDCQPGDLLRWENPGQEAPEDDHDRGDREDRREREGRSRPRDLREGGHGGE